ncbi:MAG: DUF1934 domain-containing protein [Candidatus Merdivicinus sp.]|jgi:uncharacterized beta-barrel protein YwiB (DUF1934 family)
MKKDVSIRIKGVYTVDADQTTAELFTVGSMYKKNEHYYITYDESETTGFEGCTTTVKIEAPDRVTLIRRGSSSSHLVLQKGRRNVGSYDMMGNPMEIGVYTDSMDCSFTDAGGDLRLRYTLDMNSSLMSENELEISVSEA